MKIRQPHVYMHMHICVLVCEMDELGCRGARISVRVRWMRLQVCMYLWPQVDGLMRRGELVSSEIMVALLRRRMRDSPVHTCPTCPTCTRAYTGRGFCVA